MCNIYYINSSLSQLHLVDTLYQIKSNWRNSNQGKRLTTNDPRACKDKELSKINPRFDLNEIITCYTDHKCKNVIHHSSQEAKNKLKTFRRVEKTATIIIILVVGVFVLVHFWMLAIVSDSEKNWLALNNLDST